MQKHPHTEKDIPQELQSLFSSAAKVFLNPESERELVRLATQNTLGIYCWVNMVNGKIYVGRGAGNLKTLYGRLQDYYQPAYLVHPRNTTSLICKALLKWGMSNFALLVLEYVDSSEASIDREQYYLSTLHTPYNTQKSAGHSLGYGLNVKHSPERIEHSWQAQWGDKLLVSGPKDNPITIALLAQQQSGNVKTNPATTIHVADLLYPDVYATFYTWQSAADALGIKKQTLMKYFSRNTRRDYLGRYGLTLTKR